MTQTILLALLIVALAALVALMMYHGLAGARARRRAAWELDRAEWRQWITRQ
jgi:hypothetical protein